MPGLQAEYILHPDETAAVTAELGIVLHAGMPRAKPLLNPTGFDARRIAEVLFEDAAPYLEPVMHGLERLRLPPDPMSLLAPWRQWAVRLGHAANLRVVSFDPGLAHTTISRDSYFSYGGRQVHAGMLAAVYSGGLLVGRWRRQLDDTTPYYSISAGPSVGTATESVSMTLLPSHNRMRINTSHGFDPAILAPLIPGVAPEATPAETAVAMVRSIHCGSTQ